MTITTETTPAPIASSEEVITSLDEMLHRFINLLAETRPGTWSKAEEDVVRRARTALTNAGHPPVLGHETLAHLDYPLLDGSER